MKKKYALVFLFFLVTCSHSATMQSQQPQSKVVPCDQSDNELCSLLDEARSDGIEQEIIEIRPVSAAEFWFRHIGSALFVKCLAVQKYVSGWWHYMVGNKKTEQTI